MISLKNKPWLLLACSLALGACDGDSGTDAGTDAGDDVDAGRTEGVAPTCEEYCSQISTNCTGTNAQYADEAECLAVCNDVEWATGDEVTESGPTGGNTLGCRQYHAGVAADDADLHCPHASDDGAGVCGSLCEAYCELVLSVCTGDQEIFANGEECMTACEALDDSGTRGATSGDTLQCRLYHVGVASREDMRALHCPHAAPDGGGVCVGGWEFSTTDPTDYTPVDAMGMPAVSTALVPSARKNAYNDRLTSDNADFVADFVASVTGLHDALDDDLTDLGLSPCTMGVPVPPMNSNCLEQEVAAGVSVASLVVPDDLTLNLNAASGFPNGRGLTEPVIDVTLAIILLDIDATRTLGDPPHNAGTLAGVPVNPDGNDVTLLTEFPYFAPAHEVP